jgi:hypothetical protein
MRRQNRSSPDVLAGPREFRLQSPGAPWLEKPLLERQLEILTPQHSINVQFVRFNDRLAQHSPIAASSCRCREEEALTIRADSM